MLLEQIHAQSLRPPVLIGRAGARGLAERALCPCLVAAHENTLAFWSERGGQFSLKGRAGKMRNPHRRNSRWAAYGIVQRQRIAARGANHMKKSATTLGESTSRLIDAKIKALDDWRGKTLAHVRALIKQADPEVVEEWKWSVPVWSHDGIICTGETYKRAVKLTFAKGASLEDPSGLFNSSLQGKVRRAIDLLEGDEIDAAAFKTLIRAAAALNRSSAR
jgi:hypothetical protein